MNPTNQHPIYAWLSNVQEGEPVEHWPPYPSPGIAHQEPSNELTTPHRMRLRSAQRGSDNRTRGEDYGRKPRHKTREDRYEYKAPTSAAKRASETERPRPKRQRPGRKHTLNDDFQAANVVHSRLTLHQIPNMGVFNKGKTSSPVNPRPALGTMMFSETDFLAPRKDHGTKPKPSVIPSSSKKRKGKQTNLHQHLFEYNLSTPNTSKRGADPPLSRWWPALNEPRLQAHDLHQQLSADHNRDGVRILESVSSYVPQRSNQRGKEKAIQDICAGNHYTWSDSAPHSTQGYALQEHLLNILHRVLDIYGTRQQSPLPPASRDYLDLEHLKRIMEERQRNWEPSSKDSASARRGPTAPRRRRLSIIRSCETVSTRVFHADQNHQNNVNPGEASGANNIDYIDTPQIRGVEGEPNLPQSGFAIDTHRDVQNRPQSPQHWEQGPERILNDTEEEYSSRRVFDTLRDVATNVDRPSGTPYLSHSHREETGDLQSSSISHFPNPPVGSELAEIILNHADEAFWHTLDMAYAMVNSEHADQEVSRRDFSASDTLPQAQDLTRYDPPEAAFLGLLDAPQTERAPTMDSRYSTQLFPNAHVIEPDEVNRLHGQVQLDGRGHGEAARAPRLNRPYHPDASATALHVELEVVSRTSWLWPRNQLY